MGLAELPDAADLIDRLLERSRGLSSYSEVSMTVHRPDWERNSSLKSWTRGEADSLIRFIAPARDAGNGTLKKGSQMWTYTPKLNRVIRLPSSMMSQSWGGSDFSYNDLARSDELREHFDHRIEAAGESGGQALFRVTSIPRPGAPVVWGKQELTIRADLVLIEQLFFDQDLKPLKRMTGHDFADAGDGRWLAMRMRMHTLEKDDHWTEIRYDTIKFDVDVADRTFTQFALKNP
ncbi:MAG: outer membrane lipoprotein-sorting protein [Pseudomonadota bacterium]